VFSEDELIFMVASAERGSNHPHATAMFDIARDRDIKLAWPLTFRALPGNGIIAELERGDEEYRVVIGNSALLLSEDISVSNLDGVFEQHVTNGLTPIFLAVNGYTVGIFGLEDPIREDAKSVIHELRRLSMVPVMLSGDIASVTEPVARGVGIDVVFSEISPTEKHQIVSKEQESEIGLVAMIGDGINDAPALAQADVGISMMNSSDLAQSSAVVNLLRPDLSGILYLVKLSHATIRIMRQNLGWAFIYNLLLLPIAMGAGYVLTQLFFGDVQVPKLLSIIFSENWFLNPAAAGAAMAFSSLSVILNSLRLGWLQKNY
jgi:Cu+-exporting ATPase